MRFAVNVSMLFTDLPLLRRPSAVAAAGVDAVEMWWPFADPVPSDREVDALAAAITDAGVSLAALNLFAGDLSTGDRGVLSDPDRADAFLANLPVAIDLAGRLDCQVLHAMYGNRQDGVAVQAQDELALQMLTTAAAAAAQIGAIIVVEAMNPADAPRFPLQSTAAARLLVDTIRHTTGAELGILYDVYHMQRAEGNLIATIRQHGRTFTHVQIADAPDRTPPGTGEVAFPRVLEALEATGYDGFVGLEYRPVDSSVRSLAWVHERGVR